MKAPTKVERVLSFQACLSVVKANNLDLRLANEQWNATIYERKASWSGFFPEISTQMSASSSQAGTANTATSYLASLSFSQSLFAGFKDINKVRLAMENEKIALSGLQLAQAKVLFQTKVAFTQMHFAQKTLSLTQEITKRRQLNMRLVELRFEGGRENKGSFLLSQAYLEQARYEHLQAQHSLSVAREELLNLMNFKRETLSEGMSFDQAGEIDEKSEHAPPSTSALEFSSHQWTLWVLQNPEYLQSLAQEDIAEANLRQDQSGFFPTLGLTALVGKTGSSFFPDNDRWSLKASLEIPLFSGGRTWHSSKSSATLFRASRLRTEILVKNLREKYQTSSHDYFEAVAKSKVDQLFLKAALVRSQVAKEKYKNGLLSFEDWDSTENDLILREKSSLQSLKDRVLKAASWHLVQAKGFEP